MDFFLVFEACIFRPQGAVRAGADIEVLHTIDVSITFGFPQYSVSV